MQQQISARRDVIRRVARRHHLTGLRWWAPTGAAAWLDLVVEGAPDGRAIAGFRAELESALGCRVAIYLARQIPPEAWGGVLADTVAL